VSGGTAAPSTPLTAAPPRTRLDLPRLLRLWLPPLLLLVPVAALCVLGRFDGLYGQDPYWYYNYATGPARASLLGLRPLPPFFWPPGYPLLVALVSLVLGPTPAAGQVVSLGLGAAATIFTGLLAEEVWVRGRGQASGALPAWLVPLAAALLVACQPQLWQSSAVVMADSTGLAAAAFGAWALARYARLRSGAWLILAGAGLAFAVLTRWIYGLAALAGAAYALSLMLRPQAGAPAPHRVAWLHAAGAAVIALLVLSPLLASAGGAVAPGVDSAAFAGSFQVYTWHPLNAFRREFITTDGVLSYRLPNGLYYALAPLHRYFFTPLLGALLLPGLWTALGRGRRALWWLLAWAVLVFGFHAGAPWQNFRFTLAYLAPLAVLAAVGLETVLARLGPRARRVGLALCGLGLVMMLASGVQLTQGFIARKQADLQTVARVQALLPPHARLLTFNQTFTFQHYSTLDTHELFYLAAEDLPALLADDAPTYLLLDEHNVETQWAGEPLGAAYRWLRDQRGLEPLGHFGSLTLSRVR
jgi:hypothetical protein